MKKIYSFLLLAAFSLAFTACSDDEHVGSEYAHESTVKVKSADVLFSAAAGTGSVEFEAPAAATASVDAHWASAVVNGNKVDVTVAKNAKLEGRTALLTIRSGEDSTQVTIQQRGMMFKYGGEQTEFIYNDEARTLSIPVSNEGADLSIKGLDWAEATITEERIDIKLAENTTGHVRSGYIKYSAGPYTDSIFVYQGEKKDVINKNYYFGAYDLTKVTDKTKSIDEVFVTELVTIKEQDGELVIHFLDKNWVLPMTLDESTLIFDVKSGSKVGTYYNYFHVFSAIVDNGYVSAFSKNDLTYLFASPEVPLTMSGYFEYSEKNGVTIAPFVDNKKNDAWFKELTDDASAEYDANTLGFFAFKTEQVAANSFQGMLSLYYEPFLMEATANPAKAAVFELGRSGGKSKQALQNVFLNTKKTKAYRSDSFKTVLP